MLLEGTEDELKEYCNTASEEKFVRLYSAYNSADDYANSLKPYPLEKLVRIKQFQNEEYVQMQIAAYKKSMVASALIL